jgi:peptide chain release factor 1
MKLASRLDNLEAKMKTLEHDLSNPEVMKDQSRFQKMAKELAELRPIIDLYRDYRKIEKEIKDLEQALAERGLEQDMYKLYHEELGTLTKKRDELRTEIEDRLLKESDPNRGRDVIIEIRAGTGGEEAALFVADLFRMYSRFASNHNLALEVMNSNPTGKGGFKEIIFSLTGGAFVHFKYESGIHRVQRVPETEASGRIHTSAVTVAVLPEADETEVEVNPGDLRIDVFRASGAGGQHVNKTESAVRITHLPSGLVVSCQDERSQHKNKAKAMRVLRARLYDAMQLKHHNELAKQRKEQVGSGDRSGKIRTYNFPDQRVTDHRIGLTLHSLDDILDGHLDELVQALERSEREKKLTDAA